MEKIKNEMDRYEAKLAELKENPAVQGASLMRDFVVLLRQSKYDVEKESFLTKYQNINVLVGKQDDIDKVKPVIESFMTNFGGSFKSEWKVSAV